MIRRLRRRMVLICMLVLLAVLVVIIGGMNLMHYRRILAMADDTLILLRDNGGRIPAGRQHLDRPDLRPEFASPELPYTTRYFSAELKDGVLIAADTGKIAAVGADSVGSYAMRALEKKASSGFVENYRFLRYAEGESTRILFLDCGRTLQDARTVLRISVGASSVGYLAVFMLVALLSGRIIKPVSESYEKQRRFITNAGHELKTPLTIIDADAGILEMEYGESEWIDDIRSQTERLARLTGDLVCLARMEETTKLEMIPIPISDLVTETAASFQAPARTQGKELAMEIQPMVSCIGDSRQLCQLVGILLDNALKYACADSCIHLTLEKQGKLIRLTVENETEGVSKETLENMFERFYRGDPAHSSAVKGYGIGLSIAQAIVSAHRGKIGAASPDGKTMQLSIQLPADR